MKSFLSSVFALALVTLISTDHRAEAHGLLRRGPARQKVVVVQRQQVVQPQRVIIPPTVVNNVTIIKQRRALLSKLRLFSH